VIIRDVCPRCKSPKYKNNGHIHNDKQNHHCHHCGRQFVQYCEQYLIAEEKRALIERLLVERISLRGICRAMGVTLSWLRVFRRADALCVSHGRRQARQTEAMQSEKCMVRYGRTWNDRRVIAVYFTRPLQRCTGRTHRRRFPILQEVQGIAQTRNPLCHNGQAYPRRSRASTLDSGGFRSTSLLPGGTPPVQ
jgi:hypothetical protein